MQKGLPNWTGLYINTFRMSSGARGDTNRTAHSRAREDKPREYSIRFISIGFSNVIETGEEIAIPHIRPGMYLITANCLGGPVLLRSMKPLRTWEIQGVSMEPVAITNRVKEIICKVTGCPVDSISDSAMFVDDLGLDSLAILE